MLGHSIISQHIKEPEGSSSPSNLILSTTYVVVFLVSSFPLAFQPIIYTRSYSPPFVLHDHTSNLPRLDYSIYTWRRVQITKLLVMQFSSFSRHLIHARLKQANNSRTNKTTWNYCTTQYPFCNTFIYH
jgi:hypothetical protein